MGRSSRFRQIRAVLATFSVLASTASFADQPVRAAGDQTIGPKLAAFGFSDSAGIIDQPLLSDIPDFLGALPPVPPAPQLPPFGFENGSPPQPALRAALPRCPLIIRVGKGLAHPARTKVIGGRPSCR